MVKDDSLDPTPSRGCPIRHLALQKSMFPPVMLIPGHEGEFQKEEQVGLAQDQGVAMLKGFISFSIGKALHTIIV